MTYKVTYNDDIRAPTYTVGKTDTLKKAESMVKDHISQQKNTKLIDCEIEPDKSGANIVHQIGRFTLRHYIIDKI